ncbi:MAG: ATP-binding protein [Bacteroidetes bacterium]|nr:ATP-binding protein [Bacteroidota bacterium]
MVVDTHTLTIPSSTSFLEEVREFVTTHATNAGFSENAVEQMKMAVDEACTNVIEHSYQGKSGQPIDISISSYPDKLMVTIRDKGLKFDREAYKEPDLLLYAKSKKSGGFGVHIMRKLMDSVEYKNAGGFNECCMTKNRS